MIVCDTGPLVALANERDEHYFTANNLFRDLFMAKEAIVLPATVMAEVCYWLNHHGGPEVEAAFLDSVADGTFTLIELTNDDVARMAELVRQFSSFTPKGGGHFTLLPETIRAQHRAIPRRRLRLVTLLPSICPHRDPNRPPALTTTEKRLCRSELLIVLTEPLVGRAGG